MQALRPIFGKLALIHVFSAVGHADGPDSEGCRLRRSGGSSSCSSFFGCASSWDSLLSCTRGELWHLLFISWWVKSS